MQNLVSLFNRPKENAPIVANLGKDNEMYYNQELKRWVEPGTEDKIREEMKVISAPPVKGSKSTTTTSESNPEHLSAADQLCQVVNFYNKGPGLHDKKLSRPKVSVTLPQFPSAYTLKNNENVSNSNIKICDHGPLDPSNTDKDKTLSFTHSQHSSSNIVNDLNDDFASSNVNETCDLLVDRAPISKDQKSYVPHKLVTNPIEQGQIQQAYTNVLPTPLSPDDNSLFKKNQSISFNENECIVAQDSLELNLKRVNASDHKPSPFPDMNNTSVNANSSMDRDLHFSERPYRHEQLDTKTSSLTTHGHPSIFPTNSYSASQTICNDSQQRLDATMFQKISPNVVKDEKKEFAIQKSTDSVFPSITYSSQSDVIKTHEETNQNCPNSLLQDSIPDESRYFHEPPSYSNVQQCSINNNFETIETANDNSLGQMDEPQTTFPLPNKNKELNFYPQVCHDGDNMTQEHIKRKKVENLPFQTIETNPLPRFCNALNVLEKVDTAVNHLQQKILPYLKEISNSNNDEAVNSIHDSIQNLNFFCEDSVEKISHFVKILTDQLYYRLEDLKDMQESDTTFNSLTNICNSLTKFEETSNPLAISIMSLKGKLLNFIHSHNLMCQLQVKKLTEQLYVNCVEKDIAVSECRIARDEINELVALLAKHNQSWKLFMESSIRSLDIHYQTRLLNAEQLLVSQRLLAEERLLEEQASVQNIIKGFEEIRAREVEHKEKLHQKISEMYADLKHNKYKQIGLLQEKDEIISKLTLEKQEHEMTIATINQNFQETLGKQKLQYANLQEEAQKLQHQLKEATEHSTQFSKDILSLKEEHEHNLLHITSQFEEDVKQLQENAAYLTSQKCSLENQYAELLQQFDILQTEKGNLESTDKELRLHNSQMESAFAKLAAEKSEIASALERLQTQYNGLSTERIKLLSEIQIQSENMGKEAQAFIEDKEKAVTALKAQIDALEQQLSAVAVEKDLVKRQLDEYTKEVSVEIMAMQASHETSQAALRQSCAESEEKYKNMKLVEEKQKGLEELLTNLQDQNKLLLQQNEEIILEKKQWEQKEYLYNAQTSEIMELQKQLEQLIAQFQTTLNDEIDCPPSQPNPQLNDKELSDSSTMTLEYTAKLLTMEKQLIDKDTELKKAMKDLEVITQKQHDAAFMLGHMALKWDLLLQRYPNISQEIDLEVSP